MSRYSVSPKARAELRGILKHIAGENRSASERMRDRFRETFALLAAHPLMGEQCFEFEHLIPGLRRFPVGNYIIYYTPTDKGIRVGHVVHGAMDQEALFRRWLLSGE
jgi:toxin ParE1/3/4